MGGLREPRLDGIDHIAREQQAEVTRSGNHARELARAGRKLGVARRHHAIAERGDGEDPGGDGNLGRRERAQELRLRRHLRERCAHSREQAAPEVRERGAAVRRAQSDHRAYGSAVVEELQKVRGDESAHRVADKVDPLAPLAARNPVELRRRPRRGLADATEAEPEIDADDLASESLAQADLER
jgi:hypothetical protein